MRILVAFLIVLTSTSFAVAADGPVDADLLLAGGTIHDGSGAEPVVGDVAIAKGKIVAVGKFARGKIAQTIDCGGRGYDSSRFEVDPKHWTKNWLG